MSRPDGNLTEACLGFEVSEALADEVKLPNGHRSCRIRVEASYEPVARAFSITSSNLP